MSTAAVAAVDRLDRGGLPEADIAAELGLPAARVRLILDRLTLNPSPAPDNPARLIGPGKIAGDSSRTVPAAPPQQPVRNPRPGWAACGTPSGWNRHRRAGQTPCEPCTAAASQASARRTARRRADGAIVTAPLDPASCGTPAGYGAHRRRGQNPCPDCRAANREYQRAWRANKSNDADPAVRGTA